MDYTPTNELTIDSVRGFVEHCHSVGYAIVNQIGRLEHAGPVSRYIDDDNVRALRGMVGHECPTCGAQDGLSESQRAQRYRAEQHEERPKQTVRSCTQEPRG